MFKHVIDTALLRSTELYLNEYFGISYGYFLEEISNNKAYFQIKVGVGESPALKFIEEDHEFPIYLSFDTKDFCSLFNIIKEDDEADFDIAKTLFLLAYVITAKDFSRIEDYQDFIDYKHYNIVREDLLRLYIFANERKSDTLQGQKISIKHAKGSVEITNYENWFTSKLLNDYLAVYLADIESVEQAEEELLKYKKRAGRKIKDNRIHIILYGIFRMFNDHKKMKSPQSDALCEFIISYLQFIGIFNDDTDVDNQWIRAQITYLKTKPKPMKFDFIDVAYMASVEELKNSGKRLY
jgi:hypothetical protein